MYSRLRQDLKAKRLSLGKFVLVESSRAWVQQKRKSACLFNLAYALECCNNEIQCKFSHKILSTINLLPVIALKIVNAALVGNVITVLIV